MESRALAESRFYGDIAAKAPHQATNMGEADAFALPILRPGAPKKFEDPLMVLHCDPAAIIADRDHHHCLSIARFDGDEPRPIAGKILNSVVEQISNDLLERERSDRIFGAKPGNSMRALASVA